MDGAGRLPWCTTGVGKSKCVRVVDARIPMDDVLRLLGHSSTRVTQGIYIHVRDDMYDRFFNATGYKTLLVSAFIDRGLGGTPMSWGADGGLPGDRPR